MDCHSLQIVSLYILGRISEVGKTVNIVNDLLSATLGIVRGSKEHEGQTEEEE